MFKFLIPVFALFAVTAIAADDKVIDEINSKNAQIKSFTCDLQTVLSRRAVRLTSYGKLLYEKEKNIRLTTHAATDNKFMADIGSNNGYFWVYVRRLDPNHVFYANYKDINKTNLKAGLDPTWMRDCFCLGNIDTRKATIQMQGKKLVVMQAKKSPRNTTIYKVTTIDPEARAITGNYLYDSNKQLLSWAIVTSHFTTNNGMKVPRTIETGTTDEDHTIDWTLTNYKFNVQIPADTFKMPSFQLKRVDLTNEKIRGVND